MGYTRYPSAAGGAGITTYANQSFLPLSAPDGTLAITIDTHTLWIYDAGTSQWVAIANENTVSNSNVYNSLRNGVVSLDIGNVSQTINFPTAFSDTNYALDITIQNTTDSGPQYLQFLVTARLASGFTITFNAPIASANYVINYTATAFSAGSAGTVTLASGTVPLDAFVGDVTHSFTNPLPNSGYSLEATLQNTVDPVVAFLQPVITQKLASQFKVNFNGITTSANYVLNFMATARGSNTADIVPILSGQDEVGVIFAVDLSNPDYAIDVCLENDTDLYPIFLQTMIVAKSIHGFTVKFNAPTDTANYSLHYTIREA